MLKNEKIISTLIGLSGTVGNTGKTDNTDMIVRYALRSDDSEEIIESITAEKYNISPNCEACPNPCGNTSDFNILSIKDNPKNIQKKKMEIINTMVDRAIKTDKTEIPDVVFKALQSLKYELTEESYNKILEELYRW